MSTMRLLTVTTTRSGVRANASHEPYVKVMLASAVPLAVDRRSIEKLPVGVPSDAHKYLENRQRSMGAGEEH